MATPNLTRRTLLGAATTAAAGIALTKPPAADARLMPNPERYASSPRPNVLWIITDDQPRHMLRFMPQVNNRLVDLGMKFRNGYCAVPLCGPARVSLQTGMYAHNHGCTTNATWDPYTSQGLDQDTVATRMHASGYTTGYFGKYINGLGHNYDYVPPGWDHFVGTFGANADRLFGTGSATVNFDGRVVARPSNLGGDDIAASHLTHWVTAMNGSPWFAIFAPTSPHTPYTPSVKHANDYNTLPWNPPALNEEDLSDKAPRNQGLPPVNPAAMRKEYEGKAEELRDTDDQINTLLDALAHTGQLKNTYIFFITDNGYMLGEHRLFKKHLPYEESAGTPFVVRGPGITPGVVSNTFVSQVDLMPTTLEIAGLNPDHGRVLDGRSMLTGLTTRKWHDWRQRIISEGRGWTLLREGDHALIYYPVTGESELYNLCLDPYQMRAITTNKDYYIEQALRLSTAAGKDLRELETG